MAEIQLTAFRNSDGTGHVQHSKLMFDCRSILFCKQRGCLKYTLCNVQGGCIAQLSIATDVPDKTVFALKFE